MKHKIVIYTSSHLRTTPKTVCIANAISKALGDLGIEHRELSNTNLVSRLYASFAIR